MEVETFWDKNKTYTHTCKKHGEVKAYREKKNGIYHTLCSICKRTYLRNKKHRIKEKLVDYMGSKCSFCGYDKCIDCLEFHHKNPGEKKFGISDAISAHRTWDYIVKEVEKCLLLCNRCHRELHHIEHNDNWEAEDGNSNQLQKYRNR